MRSHESARRGEGPRGVRRSQEGSSWPAETQKDAGGRPSGAAGEETGEEREAGERETEPGGGEEDESKGRGQAELLTRRGDPSGEEMALEAQHRPPELGREVTPPDPPTVPPHVNPNVGEEEEDRGVR
ncbi:unnamed protein product [Gadus morhua 'NCC']